MNEEKINTKPNIMNLLENGEEKCLYYDGGTMTLLYGPLVIIKKDEKYLYLVSTDGKTSDIWEALKEKDNIKMRQYAETDRNELYACMLTEYTIAVGKKSE